LIWKRNKHNNNFLLKLNNFSSKKKAMDGCMKMFWYLVGILIVKILKQQQNIFEK
jgi:hypothetical protein